MFIFVVMYFMMMILFMTWILLIYFLLNKEVVFMEFSFLKFMSLKLELMILFDWISILFMSVVILISLMVVLYSIEYMENDLNLNRFIMMVLMFVLSMVLMIISPNLISILLGWDGLGLVSYCLVIYYQSNSSFNSGMITVLTNRLGDILILMSIGLMTYLGSWNYMFLGSLNSMIIYMLMIASFTKSAQIPFSSWLPLAMAAPTPVSSLVHSSTLVTAGVYLMIRMNYLILDQNILNFMMLISVMTMFMSGLGANLEFDFKKVIALSTLSQLGVMFFCLSIKLSEITLFHLLTHAMFKSMLFMCVGVIIHNMIGNQDIRLISMVMYNMPIISVMFNCSVFSLCGVPFMSGFFSKDMILEMFMMNKFNKFIFIMLFMSMGLTMMYSIRLIYYSFIKIPQLMWYSQYSSMLSFMGVSMYLLFFFSIIKGLILSWILFSLKNLIFLTFKLKMMIYMFMLMGCLIMVIMKKINLYINQIIYLNNLIKFMMMLWFMPMLYSSWKFQILKFSNKMIYEVEMGWLEYFMGLNLKNLMMKIFKVEFLFKNYYFMVIFFLMMLMILMF